LGFKAGHGGYHWRWQTMRWNSTLAVVGSSDIASTTA
jgi:hypothetical protein